MRLRYLQISNILSFSYHEQISDAPKIVFDRDFSILIGENGAGKSTVLEIINFLFRRVFYRLFSFNGEIFSRRKTASDNERRQTLSNPNLRDLGNFRLDPNWDHEDSTQIIRVSFELDDLDKANIINIKTHYTELSDAVRLYSSHEVSFASEPLDCWTVDITLQRTARTYRISSASDLQNTGYVYLSDYHYFKNAIAIYNDINPATPIPPLFESFTLISSYRNYQSFQSAVSLVSGSAQHQIQQSTVMEYSRSLTTSDNAEPAIFNIVRLRIAELHYNAAEERLSPLEREE